MIVLQKNLALLKIIGKNSFNLLQGQLSCDLRGLEPYHFMYGAYCNIYGKVEALLKIWIDHEDNYCLQIPSDIAQKFIEKLKVYAKLSKVDVIDISHIYTSIGATLDSQNNLNISDDINSCGISISDDIINSDGINISANKIKLQLSQQAQKVLHRNDYVQYLIDRADFKLPVKTSEDIDNIAVKSSSNIYDIAVKTLGNIDNIDDVIDEELFNIWHKLPFISNANSGKLLAHDLEFSQNDVASLQKGCYLGQEIIARMHYKSKKSKKLMYISFSPIEQPEYLPLTSELTKPISFSELTKPISFSELTKPISFSELTKPSSFSELTKTISSTTYNASNLLPDNLSAVQLVNCIFYQDRYHVLFLAQNLPHN